MADVKIRIRPNGPFLVEGAVELTDSAGNAYPLSPDKPAIALCRWGPQRTGLSVTVHIVPADLSRMSGLQPVKV